MIIKLVPCLGFLAWGEIPSKNFVKLRGMLFYILFSFGLWVKYQTNCFAAVAGVYLAERLNRFLGKNWKSFSSQNYFDPSGLFMSVLWSGPLLVISMIILVSIFLHITFSVLVLFLHRILT